MTAICPVCGNEFSRAGRMWAQKYCSTACRSASTVRQRREVAPAKCVVCGQPYKPRNAGHAYCSTECHRAVFKPKAWVAIPKRKPKPTKDQGVLVIPADQKQRKDQFTDEQFSAAYLAIRRELQAQGKPLYVAPAPLPECDWCGAEYRPVHGLQKYCSQPCGSNADRYNKRTRRMTA